MACYKREMMMLSLSIVLSLVQSSKVGGKIQPHGANNLIPYNKKQSSSDSCKNSDSVVRTQQSIHSFFSTPFFSVKVSALIIN